MPTLRAQFLSLMQPIEQPTANRYGQRASHIVVAIYFLGFDFMFQSLDQPVTLKWSSSTVL